MAVRRQLAGTRQQGASSRRERANRILDAAEALILRLGYNKTTIDDIARQAGVAKGTIYLHWKTREDLFKALVISEALAMIEDIRHRLAEDHEASPLRSVFRYSALALMKRPLLQAVLLRDMDVLGRLACGTKGDASYAEKLAGFETYLEILRKHRMVRTDLSLRAQSYAVTAIFMGFFFVAPLTPDGIIPRQEEFADLLAETVHRTLEARLPASPEDQQAASRAFLRYLGRYAGALRGLLLQKVDAGCSGGREAPGEE